MGLFRIRASKKREKAAAEFVTEQTPAAAAPAGAARQDVTAEARPNPDLPGWGRTIGQEIGKARHDRTSQD